MVIISDLSDLSEHWVWRSTKYHILFFYIVFHIWEEHIQYAGQGKKEDLKTGRNGSHHSCRAFGS